MERLENMLATPDDDFTAADVMGWLNHTEYDPSIHPTEEKQSLISDAWASSMEEEAIAEQVESGEIAIDSEVVCGGCFEVFQPGELDQDGLCLNCSGAVDLEASGFEANGDILDGSMVCIECNEYAEELDEFGYCPNCTMPMGFTYGDINY